MKRGSMDDSYVPVTVRYGLRELPSGPFDGLPGHLTPVLSEWVFDYLDSKDWLAARIVNRLHIRPQVRTGKFGHPEEDTPTDTLRWMSMESNPIAFLDVVEMVLTYRTAEHGDQSVLLDSEQKESSSPATSLRHLLEEGASIWTVSPDGALLQRKVSDVEIADYLKAASPADAASEHLKEVWGNVYGLHPDPSDAWDHSVKAVEAMYIPIVCPAKDKANLGSVAGDLKAQPQRWQLGLGSTSIVGGVGTLEAMIRLIWPNPDRHEGRTKRTPTLEEATAVLHVAITLVQWARTGVLVKKS